MGRCLRFCCCLALALLICANDRAVAQTAQIASAAPGAFVHSEGNRAAAVVAAEVRSGQGLETDQYGRMSLLLPDHMLLKIASSTYFVFEAHEESGVKGNIQKGTVWLRGQRRETPVSVRTPTAVAAIRGTEWYMSVAEDGMTTVGVLDGRVDVSNELGSVSLTSREIAVVSPGQPPVKAAYLTPENAVNWTLNYWGLWNRQDIDRAPPGFASVIHNALASYHENDLETAFGLLEQSRGELSNSAEWHALAGFLDLMAERPQAARLHFETAANLAPDWALPPAHLALIGLVENNLASARAQAEAGLRREPGSSVAMIAMAYVLKAELKLEDAYAMSRKAVEASPEFAPALLVAATVALELNRLKDCRNYLERVSTERDQEAKKLTIRGYLNLREGDNRGALEDFKKAATLDPDDPDSIMGEGISLFNLNQVEAGLKAIVQATLMAPQVSAYQSYLAKAYAELRRYEEALRSLDRAKRLDPKDPTPYLYEALVLYSLHRPSEALTRLEQAQRLNNNRAVFRSRYLLDQDEAVLMADVSRIYNELGFTSASVQQAALALTRDPTNEAANRRLYFALLFNPRTYLQASASQKLMAKLMVPPTRTSVVFDEGALPPYEPMFDRSGVDGVLFGQFDRHDDEQSEIETYTGSVAVAGKLDIPLAFSLQTLSSTATTTSRFGSTTAGSGYVIESEQNLKQDLTFQYYNSFVKWQPTPFLGFFGGFESARPQFHSQYDARSTYFIPDVPPITRTSFSLEDSDAWMHDFDGGLHLDLLNGFHGFLHASYHKDFFESKLLSRFDPPPSEFFADSDEDKDVGILQAAIWKTWENHFVQFGLRGFQTKGERDSSFLNGGVETRSQSQEEADLTTVYLLDQWNIWKDIYLAYGLSSDFSRYELNQDHEYGVDTVSPVVGLTWGVDKSWTLRTAYMESRTGDRNERLQPALIAGFPWLGASAADTFTTENLLNMTRQTFGLGLDYQSSKWPFFCGVEGLLEQVETQSYVASGDEMQQLEGDMRSVLLYCETLITSKCSTGLAYRYSELGFPYSGYENRVDASIAYFLPHGMALKLFGLYRNLRPDADETGGKSEESFALEPELTWYLSRNRFFIGARGHLEDRKRHDFGAGGQESDTITWVRLQLGVYF